jgi:hypothetical protein
VLENAGSRILAFGLIQGGQYIVPEIDGIDFYDRRFKEFKFCADAESHPY